MAEAYHLPPNSLREDPLLGRSPVAWRVEVNGEVTSALEEGLKRRIRRAVGQGANLLILELHCGGGDTVAASDLAKFFRNLTDGDGKMPVMTVAYIPENAPDTATFLALGCTEIVMNKNAETGDFTAFLYETRDGQKVPVETDKLKMESLVGLAQSQGYPPLLARGMLDRQVTIHHVVSQRGQHEWRFITGDELEEDKRSPEPKWGKAMLVKEGGPNGRSLVLKADDAKKLGLARYVVDGLPEVYALYGLNAEQVRQSRTDWLDDVATFLRMPIVSVFLVMIGITCLILELKVPGIGLPGVVAAICFVLFLWSHAPQISGQMTVLAIMLFALGLILLGLEIFVLPGFGVAGISGVVLVFGSLGLVVYGHWPQSSYEWVGFGKTLAPFSLSVIGAAISAFVLVRYLPNIPIANRLILKPEAEGGNLLAEETANPHSGYAALLGAIGVAATPLRPAGKVQFGDDFVDVLAEGSYIVPGTRVQVIEIEGNRVVVKEV